MSINVPALTSDSGLGRYLQEIRRFPVLEAEEEFMLARRLREHGDVEAAHKLVTSHLRLVAKIAMGYRNYGLPMADLIAEGNIGLMRAVKKFEPERGFRLTTYAIWWIKASLHEYLLNSWSIVKIGSQTAQKKLFFGLRRMKARLGILEGGDMFDDQVEQIAREMNVKASDVVAMNQRMSSRDSSLNMLILDDGGEELQDFLVDETDNQEVLLSKAEESARGKKLLLAGLATLNERERHIIKERFLREDPITLEALGVHYGISRERVRQIEARAFQKLQAAVKAAA